jgi:hypothetical protein
MVIGKRPASKFALVFVIVFLAATGSVPIVYGHGTEARYFEILNWKSEHIAKVYATNQSEFSGVTVAPDALGKVIKVEGRSCLYGEIFVFDIDDNYAFDIDEPVDLSVTYQSDITTPFEVGYDKNGGTGMGLLKVNPVHNEKFPTAKFTLDRARFAGEAAHHSDFAIYAPGHGGLVVCDINIQRSFKTKTPAAFGTIKLSVNDGATGILLPSRVGIYDSTGRAPLPSDGAVMLQRFSDDLRAIDANTRTFWPSENRKIFYVDGTYETKVPIGTYEVVVSHGIEYKFYKKTIEVKKDEVTDVSAKLERWVNMPAEGWRSGDDHVHFTRDTLNDDSIWAFTAGEDIDVANILEMGNIIKVYFDQPKQWDKNGRYLRDDHYIVSGQESPRTGFFGHVIFHNIDHTIHLPTDEYFQCDKVFEGFKEEGSSVGGFAHMGWDGRGRMPLHVQRGVVLTAPTGLLDFIEILQGGRLVTDAWYRLLNLGMKVKPGAGTDWPYTDIPGTVRYYVKSKGPNFDLATWYRNFLEGRTFITNGPMVDLTVNGSGLGEEIHVQRGTKLKIAANARLNPDLDKLDKLELIVLGDTVKTQSADGKSDHVEMNTEITADHSMWIAVKATGKRQLPGNITVAHTAPVYVVVDQEPTWKRNEVPVICLELQKELAAMLTEPYEQPVVGNEPWETRTVLAEQWLNQRALVRPEILKADAGYNQILVNWSKFSDKPVPESPVAAAIKASLLKPTE